MEEYIMEDHDGDYDRLVKRSIFPMPHYPLIHPFFSYCQSVSGV